MRKILTRLTLILVFCIGVSAFSKLQSQIVVAKWHFDNPTKQGAITDNASFASSPYTADDGIVENKDIATISLGGSVNYTGWVTGASGTPDKAPNSSAWNLTDGYWQIGIVTTGYKDLTLSSKQQSSNTGPTDFQIQYSTDNGSSWLDVGTAITVANNFTSGVVTDLALPAECNNLANLLIRWRNTSDVSVNNATVAPGGTNRIDDIVVMGTLDDPCLATVPFFEGFENGYNHDDVVEGCWTQESLAGAEFWTANQTYVDYNRTPKTGDFNAFLGYNNTDWLFYRVNLIQGQAYDFTVWARQDATSGATLTLACGTESNAAAMTNIIVDAQVITNGDYQEVRGTFTVPTDGVYYIGIKGTTTYSPWYLSIDDISLDFGPTCVAPENIQASNITSDATTITWDASITSVAAYNVYSSDVNAAPADDIANSEYTEVSGVTTTLGGLTPNTTYYVWVRSDCSASDMSSWGGPVEFTTSCAPESTLPYTENFDSYSVGNFPDCWLRPVVYDGYPSIVSAYSVSSPNSLRFQSLTTTPTYAISPAFSEDIHNLRVKFQLRAENTTYSGAIELGVMSDPYDLSTFESVAIIQPENTSFNAYQYDLYSTTLSGENRHIAFKHNSNAYNYYFWLDNFKVELSPNCIEVSDLVASNVTANSATISWTASGSNPDDYQVYVSLANIAPAEDETNIEISNTNSIDLTGLNNNPVHYVWVRADCGAGDYSTWTGPLTVWTSCVPLAGLPYEENFDSYGTGSSAFPNCWARPVTYSGYPYIVSAYSASSPASLRFNSSTTDPTYAISPAFAEDIHNLRVSFNLKAEGIGASQSGTMELGVMSNPDDIITFESVAIIQPTDNGFNHYKYDLNGTILSGPNNYIALRHNSNSSSWYYWLDDFKVELSPTCIEPNGFAVNSVTANSATISWNASTSSPANYNVYYSEVNTAPADDIANSEYTEVSGVTTTLGGLTPNTTYYVWVRSDCSASDMSSWGGPVEFTTSCAPESTLPYTENFDSYSVGNFPDCWLRPVVYDGYPSIVSAYSVSSPNSLRFQSSTITPTYAISPAFSEDIQNLRVKFQLRAESTTSSGTIELGVMSDPYDLSTFESVAIIQPENTSFNAYQYDLYSTTLSGENRHIAFKHNSNANNYYFWLDNFEVDLSPTCIEPNGFAVNSVTANSANISWTVSVSNPGSYHVYYSTSNIEPADDITSGYETTNTNSIELSNLESNTTYYVWVRSNCDGTDFSVWAGPVEVTTPMVVTPPWSEGFASSATPAGWTTSSMFLNNSNSAIINGGASGYFMYKNLYSYATTGNFSTVLVGPISGTEDFSFDYKIANDNSPYAPPASGTGNFVLEISTDFGNTWTQMDSVDNNAIAGWQNKSYPISTYAIAGDYVKFRITANWLTGGGDYCIGFDNFNLASCFPISGLSVANIEENSATISWNASTSSPANYNVYYSEVNAAPANDIADTEYSEVSGLTTTLSSLSANTKYYVWVRSACGVGDFSLWDGPIVFTTLCTPVNVPFFEGFENGYNHDDVVEGCWTQVSETGTATWVVNSTNTTNNRTPRTGSFNATLKFSNTDWLFYKVYLEQGESYDFSVWARQDVTSGATLTLACGTESNAAAMTIVIVDEQAIISGDYQEVKGTFSVPIDGIYYIGIKGTLNSNPWYLSIDDILLEKTPTCFKPTNIVASDITTNSATISWTASSSNPDADYHVYYSNLNVAPADDIELAECEATTTNSIALSDLTDAEIYYVWVRSDCGGGDYSYWTGPFVLATECYAITTLPYFQDFEGGFTIPCWSFVDNHASVSSNWHVVSDGNPGNGLVVDYTDNNMMDEWAISPTFDLTGITESVILSFDFYMDYDYQVNPYDGADLMVKVSTDDGSTWTQIWREEDFGVFDSYEWYSVNLPFDTYLGQSNVKFAFHYLGDDGNDLAIDNVRLDYAPSSEAEILTYTIPNQVGETTIDPAGQTVELTVPYAMEVTDLVATFTLSPGASAKIGAVDQESGVTGNNFTNPVTYTVTAEDGTTTKDWTVTVNVSTTASSEAEILTYSLPNQVGEAEINSGATEGTITVTMPYDTEVANLVANFTLSYGATAKVDTEDQASGVTPNNFTDPVVYAVTAQDGSTIKNWTVTVNLEDAPSSEANILTYSFAEQYSPAVIDDVNHTVTVVVNEGTSLDALVATFTLSPGASAKIGAVDQESGVTENNFTDPVIYTVTAEDGTTTQPWTVTVSVYVGIEDVENSALAIYPNPNNGNFTLDFTNINGKVNYQIYDTKGSIIISDDFVANGSAIKEVSLNLVPGVYFVRLVTETQSLVEKLVVE